MAHLRRLESGLGPRTVGTLRGNGRDSTGFRVSETYLDPDSGKNVDAMIAASMDGVSERQMAMQLGHRGADRHSHGREGMSGSHRQGTVAEKRWQELPAQLVNSQLTPNSVAEMSGHRIPLEQLLLSLMRSRAGCEVACHH